LDMATAATVDAVLANIAQDDVIVVVATHDPRTRDACTRVIDLADYQAPTLGNVPSEGVGDPDFRQDDTIGGVRMTVGNERVAQ